jgi:hypothetical protein
VQIKLIEPAKEKHSRVKSRPLTAINTSFGYS